MGINGEVWNSIQFQNANNSVRVTDEFMLAVDAGKDWHTKSVTTGEVMDTFPARDLMRKIAEAAWICGDPGMQFDSTINRGTRAPTAGASTVPTRAASTCTWTTRPATSRRST